MEMQGVNARWMITYEKLWKDREGSEKIGKQNVYILQNYKKFKTKLQIVKLVNMGCETVRGIDNM